jgi:hypothetical protein
VVATEERQGTWDPACITEPVEERVGLVGNVADAELCSRHGGAWRLNTSDEQRERRCGKSMEVCCRVGDLPSGTATPKARMAVRRVNGGS